MTNSEKIEQYIEKHSHWKSQLQQLRSVFLQTELQEKVKRGAPIYTLNKRIVADFGAFKNHSASWFHQGVFLKDTEKQLVNVQKIKTQALWQWKFVEESEVDLELIKSYILEAIKNCRAEKKLASNIKKELVIPELLKSDFQKNKDLETIFYNLSPGKQRDSQTNKQELS